MEDGLKKLADLIINGKLKPGIPRFDPQRLQSAKVSGNEIAFKLDYRTLYVPLDELNANEARLAYDKYASDNVVPNVVPVSDKEPDRGVTSEHERGILTDNAEESDKDPGLIVGLFQAVFYIPSVPWNIYKYRLIFVAILLCTVFGAIVIVEISHIPVNNDKNQAITIAMDDHDLKNFLAGKSYNLDSSADYYDPSTGTIVRGNIMRVMITVWVSQSDRDISLSQIEEFIMIVDLKNKAILSTDQHTIMRM